jgi:molybdopterin-guanine dinucleotide biosynthesis protein A
MQIAAIALAGGRSSRMGQDKALILVDGEPMLRIVCLAAAQVTDRGYVVVREAEQYQRAIATNFTTNFTFVIDHCLDGALVGFSLGIQAITPPVDWILLLACDLPNLQGDILQAWAHDLAALPEDAIAYLPRSLDGKNWEPLCGFYRWQAQISLNQFIEQGGRSFQKWLSNHQVIEIASVPSRMLLNCNKPEDLPT